MSARFSQPDPDAGMPQVRLVGRPSAGALRASRTWQGFTLVELLTVIAVVAVLGTLLLTGMHSARRKSRQAHCTANLHQLSLAINMYSDDYPKRLRRLSPLAQARYLPEKKVLLCPEDQTGNWGGLVHGTGIDPGLTGAAIGSGGELLSPVAPVPAESVVFSYVHPLSWGDTAWARLMRAGSLAGLAACQLHGLGKPNRALPSASDFQGLVLRAQQDGAVVRRKVFLAGAAADAPAFNGPVAGLPSDHGEESLLPAEWVWPLFADEPAQ